MPWLLPTTPQEESGMAFTGLSPDQVTPYRPNWYFSDIHFHNSRSLVAQMVKNLPAVQEIGRPGFDPWVRKIPCKREWLPTLVFLPREFHGQRRLAGYSPSGSQRIGHHWATNTFTSLAQNVFFPSLPRRAKSSSLSQIKLIYYSHFTCVYVSFCNHGTSHIIS